MIIDEINQKSHQERSRISSKTLGQETIYSMVSRANQALDVLQNLLIPPSEIDKFSALKELYQFLYEYLCNRVSFKTFSPFKIQWLAQNCVSILKNIVESPYKSNIIEMSFRICDILSSSDLSISCFNNYLCLDFFLSILQNSCRLDFSAIDVDYLNFSLRILKNITKSNISKNSCPNPIVITLISPSHLPNIVTLIINLIKMLLIQVPSVLSSNFSDVLDSLFLIASNCLFFTAFIDRINELYHFMLSLIQPSMPLHLYGAFKSIVNALLNSHFQKSNVIFPILSINPSIIFATESSGNVELLSNVIPFHLHFLQSLIECEDGKEESNLPQINLTDYVNWDAINISYIASSSNLYDDNESNIRIQIIQLCSVFIQITSSFSINGKGIELVKNLICNFPNISFHEKELTIQLIISIMNYDPNEMLPILFLPDGEGNNFLKNVVEIPSSIIFNFFSKLLTLSQKNPEQIRYIISLLKNSSWIDEEPNNENECEIYRNLINDILEGNQKINFDC